MLIGSDVEHFAVLCEGVDVDEVPDGWSGLEVIVPVVLGVASEAIKLAWLIALHLHPVLDQTAILEVAVVANGGKLGPHDG